MNTEELKTMLDEFKASLPRGMAKEDVEKAVAAEVAKLDIPSLEGVNKRLDDIGAKITEMGEQASKIDSGRAIMPKGALDTIKKAYDEKRPVDVAIKAAGIITTANFAEAPHSFRTEVDRTINTPPSPERVIYERLVKSTTRARAIYWTNRVNEEGAAAFIAEGALKPLKDWERAEEVSLAKKVAVMSTLTTEALDDVLFLEQEVNEVLREEVVVAIADAILNDTETTTTLKGIIPVATSYTTTSLDDTVQDANRADAIRAGMLQLRLLRHVPTVVFLNPGDAAILDLTKDSNGNYIKLQVDGVLQRIDVVETTEIEAGHFLLMDERKWKIRILEDINSRWGYNEDDFSHNRVSVVFEARLHSYINSVDLGAVLYGDFDTIIAAIQAP